MKPSRSSSAATRTSIGLLRRDLRERAGNVPAHPDVLVGIPEEECQRVDDRLAVADERRAGAALEPAVSQQRDERGDEDEVVDALTRRARRSPSPRPRLRAPNRTGAESADGESAGWRSDGWRSRRLCARLWPRHWSHSSDRAASIRPGRHPPGASSPTWRLPPSPGCADRDRRGAGARTTRHLPG